MNLTIYIHRQPLRERPANAPAKAHFMHWFVLEDDVDTLWSEVKLAVAMATTVTRFDRISLPLEKDIPLCGGVLPLPTAHYRISFDDGGLPLVATSMGGHEGNSWSVEARDILNTIMRTLPGGTDRQVILNAAGVRFAPLNAHAPHETEQ